VLLSGLALPARAQNTLASTAAQPLSLTQALQTGAAQNLSLQTAGLQIEQQRALSRTGYDVPRTVLDYQYGQISGPFNDQSFNLIQQTALPNVYAAQRRLLQTQALTAEQRARQQRRDLAQVIRTTYYQLLVGYRRVRLLRRQDSLYQRAARAARIRYQVGETNRLEQVSAEARSQELRNRLATIRVDNEVLRRQLGQLLGRPTPADIDTTANPVAVITPADTLALSPDTNPTLGLLSQQATTSQQQTRVESLRRLPDVRVGYFNQSINKERGFQVVQAGLAVPLLGGVQKARITAARLGEQVATQQLTYAQAQLSTQLAGLRQQLARARASLSYYEQTALPQARLILTTAEKSFRAGDIEYVEYVVNTQPAWQIQENYLDQVRQYDELVANLLALIGADPAASAR
jgi:cobalt-zinc-cadmium resistance protein CzcA